MVKTSKVSLIIPCYNESVRIHLLINALTEFTEKWVGDYQIIIVDDGSTDNTYAIIEKSDLLNNLNVRDKFQLIKHPVNKGKGTALQTAIQYAQGTHLLTMDADISYHPLELIKWLKLLKGHFDDSEILLGSRLHKDSVIINEDIPHKSIFGLRKYIGLTFNLFVRLFTFLNVSDTQSGFKLYPTHLAQELFRDLKVKGWAHDVEILLKAHLLGVTIKAMPVTCYNREGSKINIIRDSIKMFLQTLYISVYVHLFWKKQLQVKNRK